FADAPALESVLPAAALLLLPMGPQAVFTALARRYQAFSLIAGANLFGHIAGVACALGLAWLGAGLWSLVALRVVAPTVLCLILILGMRCAVPLRLSLERLRELAAFAGLHLADRLVENLIIALFHFMVNALFGLTVLGWLNMAMRLVEPLRGAVGAMGHNIAFSFFARAQSDAEKLGQAVVGAIRDTSILTLPAFVGLAAVMPILLPLAAGPGWEPAIPIAQALALAAALGTPMGMVHTGLTALGRPVFGLISSILGLIALVLALLLIGPEGALLVGVAKLCQEAMETLYIHHPLSRILKVSPLSLIKTLSPLLPGAVAMAALVLLLGSVLAPETALSRILVLMLQVLGGAVLFLGLTALIARSRVTSLLALFRARPAAQEP
ncbi:MAG: oligosaccharide flippase family protein, partial [Rhodospirillaceae bacterium]